MASGSNDVYGLESVSDFPSFGGEGAGASKVVISLASCGRR